MTEEKQIKKVMNKIMDQLEFEEHCEKKNIPLKMPYTIEDIENCKDIDHDKVCKDFINLCNFKADTNPKKFCGNKILYKYQFKNLLKCVNYFNTDTVKLVSHLQKIYNVAIFVSQIMLLKFFAE